MQRGCRNACGSLFAYAENRNLAGENVGGLRGLQASAPGPAWIRGLPARFPLKMIHRIIFRALQAPGPILANQLENNIKQFAPETRASQRELPGRRKPAAVRKNEFTHFLRPDAGFRCGWLPGSGGLRFRFSLRQLLLRRQTQVFCFSFDSKEKRTPFPVKFLFFGVSFSSDQRAACRHTLRSLTAMRSSTGSISSSLTSSMEP